MRLIDADELILAAQQDGAYGYVSAKEIADAPTIDAEPVRHGRWVEEPGMLICSECGDAWALEQTEEVESFNYCPNCGAKMDGGTT